MCHSEFARKPRDFGEIPRWKATEFRFFALYSGIVILKNCISSDQYFHFCLLATSLRLLSDPTDYAENIPVSQTLLNHFVENYPQFYGLKNVNYNVHSVLHLPSYVARYGPLDNFSGYIYENFMQEIKRNIHSPHHILQQLHNRLCERDAIKERSSHIKAHKIEKRNDSFESNKHTFKCNGKESVCSISFENETIQFVIKKFVDENGTLFVIGNRYVEPKPFFEEPVDSRDLGITLVQDLSTITEKFPSFLIHSKLVRLPVAATSQFVLIPLLHEPEKQRFID